METNLRKNSLWISFMALGLGGAVGLLSLYHWSLGWVASLGLIGFALFFRRPLPFWFFMMFVTMFGISYFGKPLSSLVHWALPLYFVVICWAQQWGATSGIYWGDERFWVLVGFWFLWSLIGLFFSVDLMVSVKEITRYAFSFFVLLTYINWLRSEGQMLKMIQGIETLTVCIAAICVFESVMWSVQGIAGAYYALGSRLPTLLLGPNPPTIAEIGMMISVILPITVALLFDSKTNRGFRFGMVALMLAGIYASTSRAALLSAFTSLFVLVWLISSRDVRRLMLLSLMTLLVFLFLYITEKFGEMGSFLIHHLSGRHLLWNAALDGIVQHPLFGVGAGCWSEWLPTKYLSVDFILEDLKGNTFYLNPATLGGQAHQLFLTKAVEMGIPATLLMLSFFGCWTHYALYIRKLLAPGWHKALVNGSLASMAGLFLLCQFENGPIIGKAYGAEIILVWFVAAIPYVMAKIAFSEERQSEVVEGEAHA